MKNKILANQLEERNRNYRLLLNSAIDKNSLGLIKKRILNDILSKSSFPIPPREDDDFPQPSPQPEEPVPTPNPEDENLNYLGPTEREKILSNYQLFSNKPNWLVEQTFYINNEFIHWGFREIGEKFLYDFDFSKVPSNLFFLKEKVSSSELKNYQDKIKNYQASFFQINGIDHSSLIVYEKKNNTWRHYDSNGWHNNLLQSLNLSNYQEMPTPTQSGRSCVNWTMAISKLLLERYHNSPNTMNWEIMNEERYLRNIVAKGKSFWIDTILARKYEDWKKMLQERFNRSLCRDLEIERAKLEEILFGESVWNWISGKQRDFSLKETIEAINYLVGTEDNFNKLMDDCKNSDCDSRDSFSYSLNLRDEKFKKIEKLNKKNFYYPFLKSYLTS